MNIRESSQADIDQIERIYDRILDEEEAGNTTIGWVRGIYPTRSTAVMRGTIMEPRFLMC